RGSLDDLRRLPAMRQAQPDAVAVSAGTKSLSEGQRNHALFRHALRHARHVDDEDTLLDVVRTENEHACAPRLPDTEVVRLVRSAWRYQVEGRNLVGGKVVLASFNEIEDLASAHPDAFALLMMLRRFHNDRAEFSLGKAMASKLSWSL